MLPGLRVHEGKLARYEKVMSTDRLAPWIMTAQAMAATADAPIFSADLLRGEQLVEAIVTNGVALSASLITAEKFIEDQKLAVAADLQATACEYGKVRKLVRPA